MVRIPLIVQRSWVWTFSWIIFFIYEQNGWKQIPQMEVKKALSCSFGNMVVPKGARFELSWRATMFSRGKKVLSDNMIVPQGKANFLGEQWTLLEERPKFLGEINVTNLLAIIIISYYFLYRLLTYHWKGLEES